HRTGVIADLAALYERRQLLGDFASRELRARYKGSALGFAWNFFIPLLQLVVFTILFGVLLRTPSRTATGDQPYAIFLFAGLVPWTFFASSLQGGAARVVLPHARPLPGEHPRRPSARARALAPQPDDGHRRRLAARTARRRAAGVGRARLCGGVRHRALRRRLCVLPARQGWVRGGALRAALALLAAFAILAAIVATGALDALDQALLALVQVPRSGALDVVANLVTAAGQAEVTGTLAIGMALARLRHRRIDWWEPLGLFVVTIIEVTAKMLVPQPLPPRELSRSVPLAPFLTLPLRGAFPSGHV